MSRILTYLHTPPRCGKQRQLKRIVDMYKGSEQLYLPHVHPDDDPVRDDSDAFEGEHDTTLPYPTKELEEVPKCTKLSQE